MKHSIFKPILFGVLLGAAAFFVPFLVVKTIFFFLIMGLLFRIFWWGGLGRHRLRHHMAWADKIRSMSDEEYATFKSKAGHDDQCQTYGCRPANRSK